MKSTMSSKLCGWPYQAGTGGAMRQPLVVGDRVHVGQLAVQSAAAIVGQCAQYRAAHQRVLMSA